MKIVLFILLSTFVISFAISECPNGGILQTNKKFCYIFNSTASTFIEAEEQCISNGGHLASVQNMLENIVLSDEAAKRFTNVSNSDFWFGANDLSAQGKWAWIDGTPFRFKDWDNGQPQNSLDNGCGAVIMQGAKWISDNCFKQKPFVCTVPALAEAKTTTSPPQTECSDGWTYFNYTNSCYKVIVKNLTWSDAEMECVKEGSHLISIHSWREIVYATNLAAPYSTNEYAWTAQTWIGMSTQDNNAHFKWTDGTPFDYTDFAPGEPNSPGYENCSNIWTGQISDEGIYPCRLYNYFCNVSNANFICKKSL